MLTFAIGQTLEQNHPVYRIVLAVHHVFFTKKRYKNANPSNAEVHLFIRHF